MNKVVRVIILFSLFFSWLFSGVNAAEINVASSEGDYGGISVSVVLGTDGEAINAVQGKIIYSADALEVERFGDGESIVGFWVDRPTVKTPGEITFSGIVPGGYAGRGPIFEIFFKRKKSEATSIKATDMILFKNDGLGTAVKTEDLSFKIGADSERRDAGPPPDRNPPEKFSSLFLPRDKSFGGEDVLIFFAKDKESGIDRYEIKKVKYFIFPSSYAWEEVTSPHILDENYGLILIKAVDRSGNERIDKVYPYFRKFSFTSYVIMTAIFALIASAVVVAKRAAVKKK